MSTSENVIVCRTGYFKTEGKFIVLVTIDGYRQAVCRESSEECSINVSNEYTP